MGTVSPEAAAIQMIEADLDDLKRTPALGRSRR